MALIWQWIGTLSVSGNPLSANTSAIYEIEVPEDIPAGSLIYVSNIFGGGHYYNIQFVGDTAGNSYTATSPEGVVAVDCLATAAGEKIQFRLGNTENPDSPSITPACNYFAFAVAIQGDTVRIDTTGGTTGAVAATINRTTSTGSLFYDTETDATALKPCIVLAIDRYGDTTENQCADFSRGASDTGYTLAHSQTCSSVTYETVPFYLTLAQYTSYAELGVGETAEYDLRVDWTFNTFGGTKGALILIPFYERIGNDAVSFTRSPWDRRLVLAAGNATQAEAYRYSDAVPEAAGSAIQIQSGATQAVSVQYGRTTRLFALFSQDGTVTARLSDDQGRTWGTVISVASGYEDVAQWIDDRDGLWVVALYKQTESRWYFAVGALNEAGNTWTFSTPATLVSDAKRAGDLQRRSDGTWEFAYITNLGAVAVRSCTNLTAAGTGTWS